MNHVSWICPACRRQVPAGVAACAICGCREDADAAEVDRRARAHAARENPAGRSEARCPKCSGEMSMRGELRGSAGGISAAFELSNVRFEYVSCVVCGYTEFYRSEVSALGQLADLLTG